MAEQDIEQNANRGNEVGATGGGDGGEEAENIKDCVQRGADCLHGLWLRLMLAIPFLFAPFLDMVTFYRYRFTARVAMQFLDGVPPLSPENVADITSKQDAEEEGMSYPYGKVCNGWIFFNFLDFVMVVIAFSIFFVLLPICVFLDVVTCSCCGHVYFSVGLAYWCMYSIAFLRDFYNFWSRTKHRTAFFSTIWWDYTGVETHFWSVLIFLMAVYSTIGFVVYSYFFSDGF